MTRYTVDNTGGESTIEFISTYPFPPEMVEIPDSIPDHATVEKTEVEEGTRVRAEWTLSDEKAERFKEAVDD